MQNKTLTGAALVRDVLDNPSRIDKCYSLFHDYSILNSLALVYQCEKRGLEVGPVASFKKWKSLGARIKKGQKALSICIPFNVKSKYLTRKVKQDDGTEKEEPVMFTAFSWKNVVFAHSQTEGGKIQEVHKCKWELSKALRNLGIKQIPFSMVNGNVQGYANENGIALNPLGSHPIRTAVHELAHKLMHTGKTNLDSSTKEVEAELVSYILGLVLKLDGVEESRGYIKHWLGSNELQEKTAMKALAVANKIYSAGR